MDRRTLKWVQCLLTRVTIGLFVAFTAACGGGGGTDSSTTPVAGAKFDEVPLRFSQPPALGETVSLTLATSEALGEILWEVALQPSGSDLSLTRSSDQRTVSFTPATPGEYAIQVSLPSNGSSRRSSFRVFQNFAFNPEKVAGLSNLTGLEEVAGVIQNQVWVRSSTLGEGELRALVQSFGQFSIIGFDAIRGLLIEFDDTSDQQQAALAGIEMAQGISAVSPRVHEGKLVPRTARSANDGSGYSDGGANWHLEYIGVEQAWDYTVGSSEIAIGIVDEWKEYAYISSHREMRGRIDVKSEMPGLRDPEGRLDDDHGYKVAGAIGARTGDAPETSGVSMTGINWNSPLVVRPGLGYSSLASLVLDHSSQATPTPKSALRVINSSWVMADYVPPDFEYLSIGGLVTLGTTAQERFEHSLTSTRDYRTLAESLARANPDVLLVFAGGNGINYPAGMFGRYGVDAKFENGAIHYVDRVNVSKLPNVMIVAAMTQDGLLARYSAYGDTVDIAAPTAYQSLVHYADDSQSGLTPTPPSSATYGGNTQSSVTVPGRDVTTPFGGTSAAAPLVTGVASLVYSINPSFTAAEVKEILISSADKFVEARHVTGEPGESGERIAKVPILNAAGAVRLARQWRDEKFSAVVTVPDPFVAAARLELKPYLSSIRVVGFEYSLELSVDGGATWALQSGATASGTTATVPLATDSGLYRISATATVLDPTSGQTTTRHRVLPPLQIQRTNVTARDALSGSALAGAAVSVLGVSGKPVAASTRTGSDGRVSLYLPPASYKVHGSLPGYEAAATGTVATSRIDDSSEITLDLVPVGTGRTGGFTGVVQSIDGQRIGGATVRISGGSATGGFFRSVVTDSNGRYALPGVSGTGSDGKPIYRFFFEVSAPGYATNSSASSSLVPGANFPLDFLLAKPTVATPPPGEGPDLQVRSIVFNPAVAAPSTAINVGFTVSNAGTQTAAASIAVVRVNSSTTSAAGTNLATIAVPQIAAGGSVDLNTTVLAPAVAGTYRVWVIADNSSSAGQSAAAVANDIVLAPAALEVTPSSAAAPDLIVQGASFNPTTAVAGSPIQVSYSIANVATSPALGSTAVVRITESSTSAAGANLGTETIPALPGGSAVTRTTVVTAPSVPGTYRVWVIADNGGTAGQTAAGAGNDVVLLASTLTVTQQSAGGPDLVAEGASVTVLAAPPGGRTAVVFSVSNSGTTTSGPTTAAIQVSTSATTPSGANAALVQIPSIAVGARANLVVPVTLPTTPGSYRLWVVVDPSRTAGQAGSSLENDATVASGTVSVGEGAAGGPDLVPQSLSFEPTRVTTGGMTLVTFSVTNIGASASAGSRASVRIVAPGLAGAGSDLAVVTVPALSAGRSYTATVGVNATVPAGEHEVWVLVDSYGGAGQRTTASVSNDAAPAPSRLIVADRLVVPGGSAEGVYGGALTGGPYPAFRLLVLENGEYWGLYGAGAGSSFRAAAFFQGTGTYNGGVFSSADLRDFGSLPPVSGSAAISVNATSGAIAGTANVGASALSLSGGPITDIPYEYLLAPSPTSIEGDWGLDGSTGDRIIVTVQNGGNFTGRSTLGCELSGTIVPRPSGKNVFDVTVNFGPSPCLLANQSARGIALVHRRADGWTQMTLAVVNPSRSAGLSASGFR
ncbi:MAG: CARDB domain-containing protein [Piscinibacter sp.]